MNTVGIFIPFPDVFKVFDSHSRDLCGMPCASGYGVLTSVEGIQNLVEYFCLVSCFSGENFAAPFALKGVKCNKRTDLLDRTQNSTVIEKNAANKSAKSQHCNIVQRKNESPKPYLAHSLRKTFREFEFRLVPTCCAHPEILY